MHVTTRHRRFGLAVVALAALGACSGDDGGSAREAGENEVLLVDLEFEPETLTVSPGTEVTWTWTENLAHNVVGDAGFESETISTGTFKHTFEEEGVFPYDCTLHPGMAGVILVE